MLVSEKNVQMYCDIVKKCNSETIIDCIPIKVTDTAIIVKVIGRHSNDNVNSLEDIKYSLQAVLSGFDQTTERDVEVNISYAE